MMTETTPAVWALVDDRAGNRGQCLGVAEALGLPFTIKEVRYGRLGSLPNPLLGASFLGLTAKTRRELAGPWPALSIGAGRRLGPVMRRIKRLSGGRTRVVQIMDPGPAAGRGELDLIAVPRHDSPAEASNVMAVTGAPHRIRPDVLAAAAEIWGPKFAHLPKPWFAVTVGGEAKGRAMSSGTFADLGRRVCVLARKAGGSLLITSSRRTNTEGMDALLAAISVPAYVHRWEQGGENPYVGYLALADAVIVTGESMSMCSEACATGGSAYIYARDDFVTEKYARLHAELYARGLARPLLETESFVPWTHPRLNAAEDVAAEIRKRFLGDVSPNRP
ncbi:MAG: nucleoside-diphosphate sugar epimerase [Alphaproteobacteria bacterium]|nr:nucleoside-diphosphate sugar epimerase [Alphaproteobacteria bacterium]